MNVARQTSLFRDLQIEAEVPSKFKGQPREAESGARSSGDWKRLHDALRHIAVSRIRNLQGVTFRALVSRSTS